MRMNMVVEQVGGQDREIECELSGGVVWHVKLKTELCKLSFGLGCKNKGVGGMGVVGGGVHAIVKMIGHAVAGEPADEHE